MPLYVGDYLADTMHLTAQQHGAYRLLLMHYWRNGPLPDDPVKLAAIARMTRREWSHDVGECVGAFFEIGADGRLHQKRIDAVLSRVGRIAENRREAARTHHERAAKAA